MANADQRDAEADVRKWHFSDTGSKHLCKAIALLNAIAL